VSLVKINRPPVTLVLIQRQTVPATVH